MSFKRTTCKHCLKKLNPERPSQLIHPECAADYVIAEREKEARAEARRIRMQAKIERAEFRKRKEAIKTLADYKREAQAALNRWIVHVRDKDRPCISCGRHHQGQYHAGHYLSRGAAPQHALNPLNIHKQCAPCNTYLHGNQAAYRAQLIELIGAVMVEALECDNAPRKWKKDELIALRDEYRTLFNQAKKEAHE